MRVLLIDVCCKIGSTGKIVYDLYSHVNQQGDEAAICYGRGKKIREKNIYKFGFDWETFIHALLTRITGYTGCFSYFSTKRLIKFIKKFKPDVVHIHELHAYFVNINMLLNYLKKLNIKVVHTLHCAFSYTGKCGHHLDCNKWKDSCGKCPRLNEYVSTFWFDHTNSMFMKKKKAFSGFNDMTIVCPSEWLAGFAKQSFLGQYPVKVIHNGIDTSIFFPRDTLKLRAQLNILPNEKIILAVAPNLMSEAKGGAWVIKLAKLLNNENIRVIMVGVDEIDIDCPNNVLLLKRIDNQIELAKMYSLADCFVTCSSVESFSMTCAEAACCGTPLVGFKSGAPESIFVGNYAKFVDYGDINSLVIAAKEQIYNKIDKAELCSIQYNLSKKNMCEDTMKLYLSSKKQIE